MHVKRFARSRGMLAGVAMVATFAIAVPAVANAEPTPASNSGTSSSTVAGTPTAGASKPTGSTNAPSTSAKPAQTTADKNKKPAKTGNKQLNAADQCRQLLGLPVNKKKPGPPVTPEQRKACDEKKKAEEQKKADAALMAAAAREQLKTAEADLEKAKKAFDAARKRRDQIQAKITSMSKQLAGARAMLDRYARQTYILGADPAFLNQMTAADAESPASYQQYQLMLDRIGQIENAQLAGSKELLASVEGERSAAEAEYTTTKATYDLVRLNVVIAKSTLGMATGEPATPVTQETFTSYPVGECNFEVQNTGRNCKQAQEWALAHVPEPGMDYTGLCLHFVNDAYDSPRVYPRAIDMFNAMDPKSKHSPDTVAPPGAIMWWAPNHVALSLGNNMLVSTDVLGSGRAWIVSFETIQRLWKLVYLGWSSPDYSRAK